MSYTGCINNDMGYFNKITQQVVKSFRIFSPPQNAIRFHAKPPFRQMLIVIMKAI